MLRLVEEALRGAGADLSAAETGEVVGIARVSARPCLGHLVTLGRAEVRLEYGEVGRPERRYAWRWGGRLPPPESFSGPTLTGGRASVRPRGWFLPA